MLEEVSITGAEIVAKLVFIGGGVGWLRDSVEGEESFCWVMELARADELEAK